MNRVTVVDSGTADIAGCYLPYFLFRTLIVKFLNPATTPPPGRTVSSGARPCTNHRSTASRCGSSPSCWKGWGGGD